MREGFKIATEGYTSACQGMVFLRSSRGQRLPAKAQRLKHRALSGQSSLPGWYTYSVIGHKEMKRQSRGPQFKSLPHYGQDIGKVMVERELDQICLTGKAVC